MAWQQAENSHHSGFSPAVAPEPDSRRPNWGGGKLANSLCDMLQLVVGSRLTSLGEFANVPK
jgi:hypothetical protein